MSKHQRTEMDFARDELMSHIHRCGVLQAAEEQQAAWMEDTISYMAERFPGLSPEELVELSEIGMRFCKPVIPHGKQHTALTLEEEDGAEGRTADDGAEPEMAGAV